MITPREPNREYSTNWGLI